MVKIFSYNVVTEDATLMAEVRTMDEARELAVIDNLEWDEGDDLSEYQVVATEDERNYEILLDLTVEWDEDDYELEMGFDPYEGCYTYDCQ